MTVPEIPTDLPQDFLPLLETLCSMGSPTGREARRAGFIGNWFNALRTGCADVDEVFNVVVDLSDGAEKVWLLDAHTDIVFDDPDLAVRKEKDIWHCPGIYDNTVHCVYLMVLARELMSYGVPVPLMFTFTAGEEGTGDLLGIRTVGKRFCNRIYAAYVFDWSIGNTSRAFVGSKRWLVDFKATGGHSWENFGSPSAIHAMAAFVSALAELVKWEPKSLSYNMGTVSGGTTVNAIAEHCAGQLDLRSIDPELLERTAAAVESLAAGVARAHSVDVGLETIGFRPAGVATNDVPPMVDWVREIHERLGFPFRTVVNSTNSNALVAMGIASTCTGLVRGGGAHTREELLDLTTLKPGWDKLRLLGGRMLRHPPGLALC